MRTILPFVALLWCYTSCAPIGSTNSIDGSNPKRLKADNVPRCTLKFSELKLGWNPDFETSPFIELQVNCQKRRGPVPKNALSGYSLVVLQGSPMALAFVLRFESFPLDESKKFIVVGAPDVPNVDVSLATPHVQTIFSRTEFSRMLPVPRENSYAIMLVRDLSKSESRVLNLHYTFAGNMGIRELSTDELKLLATKMVDMVVLGESETVKMSSYEFFWRSKQTRMFADSFLNIRNEDEQMGLSVCDLSYDGFDADAFEIKRDSPGLPNICTSITTEDPVETEPEIAPTEPEIILDDRELIHLISNDVLEDIKNHQFQPAWTHQCGNKFPQRTKLLEDKMVQDWIDFGTNPSSECRFTCKACKTYLGLGFRPDIKTKPNVITSGFCTSNIYENSDAVKKHLVYPLHLEATEFFQKIQGCSTVDEANEIIREFENKEIALYNATMNVVLIAYAQIKAGLPFQTHSALMKAIRLTGANVGTVQHSSDASKAITRILSDSFHKKLLEHLIENDQPFSIMVDSSTSFNMPFLAVYIQTLEEGYPSTHFYALIHMSRGEKSEAMMNSLKEKIQEDEIIVKGFEMYFKKRLVSFSSDSASVMVGNTKSFKIFLEQYVGRKIPNIVCLSHRLDSAYKNGLKPKKETLEKLDPKKPYDILQKWQLNYFQTFEKTSNDLYNFYSARGYKRWQHFVETAEEVEVDPRRYKYIQSIRWSDSHYCSLEIVHHNYYAVTEDCNRIRFDKDFDDLTQEKAAEHYNRLTDKYFMLVLHEFLDILSSFKIASKKFQQTSSVVVGKIIIVHDVLEAIEQYRDSLGSWLRDFLKNTACYGLCDEGECTLPMYESCEEVSINGLILSENFQLAFPYSQARATMYKNMVASVKKYFDLTLLESYEAVNPARINFLISNANADTARMEQLYTTTISLEKYKQHMTFMDRLNYACKFHEFTTVECKTISDEWVPLLRCIVVTAQDFESRDATRFWPYAKTLCQQHWSQLLLKFINNILVTPFSSSQVERGFSVMNLIRTKSRSRLDKQNLNAIMTAKINGPDIEHFNVYKYTVEILKYMARADDDTMKGGRKPSEEKLPSFFDNSRFY